MDLPERAASGPINVLVADSNLMQTQLLVSALRRRPEFSVSSCSLEFDGIKAASHAAAVDVLIMNATHAKESPQVMTLVRRVDVAFPNVPKILLFEDYDRSLVINAFRSGARGLFCFSESSFRMLCKCIQCVRQGQVWASSEQMRFLLDALSQVPSLRVVSANGSKLLTPREEQVVALVSDGLTNRDIARELRISEHTVKKYVFRIFAKLGISSP